MIHIASRMNTPAAKAVEAMPDIVRAGMNVGVHQTRQHEQPGEHDEQEVRLMQDNRQHRQNVKQNRKLELAVEAVRYLLRASPAS